MESTSPAALPERPGCITVYIALLVAATALAALYGIAAGFFIVVAEELVGLPLSFGLAAIGGSVALAGLGGLLAWGLWRQRNWARLLAIALHTLSLPVSAFMLYAALLSPGNPDASRSDPIRTIVTAAIGLVASAYAIYWFASHRAYFSPS